MLRTNSRASPVYVDARSVRHTVVRGRVGKPHSIRWYPESFTVSRSECDVMIVRARIQGWNGSNKVPSPIVRRIFFVPPKLRIAHAVEQERSVRSGS